MTQITKTRIGDATILSVRPLESLGRASMEVRCEICPTGKGRFLVNYRIFGLQDSISRSDLVTLVTAARSLIEAERVVVDRRKKATVRAQARKTSVPKTKRASNARRSGKPTRAKAK
jgi:hypothetical protein